MLRGTSQPRYDLNLNLYDCGTRQRCDASSCSWRTRPSIATTTVNPLRRALNRPSWQCRGNVRICGGLLLPQRPPGHRVLGADRPQPPPQRVAVRRGGLLAYCLCTAPPGTLMLASGLWRLGFRINTYPDDSCSVRQARAIDVAAKHALQCCMLIMEPSLCQPTSLSSVVVSKPRRWRASCGISASM